MKHKLRTALAFSWQDWGIFIRAWLMLLLVDVALRVLPFSKVHRTLARPPRGNEVRGEMPAALSMIRRMHQLVDMAARHHIYPMSCLRQALVLQRLSSRYSITTELRFGVQKEADGLMAHAWLEYAGEPIGQSPTLTGGFVHLVAVADVQ